MKTLETIQKIMNVGKIISKIVQVCCLVGGIIAAVGVVSLAFIPDSFKLGGVTIHSMIENSKDVSMGTAYASLGVAIVLCAAYWFLSKTANRYFTNELAAGTPFTFEGAKQLNVLGLYTICVPIIANFAVQIICQVLKRTVGDVADIPSDNYSSVFLGIVIIVIGLLCKYGAEEFGTKENKKEE